MTCLNPYLDDKGTDQEDAQGWYFLSRSDAESFMSKGYQSGDCDLLVTVHKRRDAYVVSPLPYPKSWLCKCDCCGRLIRETSEHHSGMQYWAMDVGIRDATDICHVCMEIYKPPHDLKVHEENYRKRIQVLDKYASLGLEDLNKRIEWLTLEEKRYVFMKYEKLNLYRATKQLTKTLKEIQDAT